MGSQPQSLPKLLLETLNYSLRYQYPLSARELWYWQISSNFSQSFINKFSLNKYFSPSLLKQKQDRQQFSQAKWQVAQRIGDRLRLIPSIQAAFVTGSLSMDNTPEDDDIDVFIVVSPHWLWITRLVVVLLLSVLGVRRPPHLPEHSSARVSSRICDNLYLDMHHLKISPHNLYLAHELLQAKPLFDKSGVQYQLLSQNSWARDFLPIAYREILKPLQPSSSPSYPKILYPLTIAVNILFFFVQYLYMRPFMTAEKISLGSAYFHPRVIE